MRGNAVVKCEMSVVTMAGGCVLEMASPGAAAAIKQHLEWRETSLSAPYMSRRCLARHGKRSNNDHRGVK